MTVPSMGNLPKMGFNDGSSLADEPWGQTNGGCQMNMRRKPEFRFTFRVGNVHMNTRLLARQEKETKLTIAQNCG